MALAYRLDAISQGPKNWGIPGPNPLQLPHVMYIHASKTLCTCINSYYVVLENIAFETISGHILFFCLYIWF